MHNSEKYQMAVDSAMQRYADAIKEKNFFECAKAIGVMEYLKIPDINHFTAFAYHINEEFEKAVQYFEKVGKDSPLFDSTQQNLAVDYMYLGDYLKLDALLSSTYEGSELEKLSLRIQCLEHVSSEYLSEHYEDILNCDVEVIPSKKYEGHEAELFFGVCRAFTIGLVAAGECINQCVLYQLRYGTIIENIDGIEELDNFLKEYKRWCCILDLSKALQISQLPKGFCSFASFALVDKEWEQKLNIFQSTNYIQQIMQIISTLCSPEIHAGIPPYEPLVQMLEAYLHVHPQAIVQVINYYFDIISDAYRQGECRVVQYLGYVYSEIIATNRDSFGLKERIDEIRRMEDNFEEDVIGIKIARSVSRKTHEAYMNALDSFSRIEKGIPGANDYSALSLQFFRVLEIEYCEKLIIPLAKAVDVSCLRDLADKSDEDWKIRAWKYDIKCLEKIQTGNQQSLEIGAVRTMLAHIIGWKTQDDPCAVYLRPIVNQLLTDNGKRALQDKEMLEVIGNAVIEKYRIPGAHTGFLPYSTACESKEYVRANLQKMTTWFK